MIYEHVFQNLTRLSHHIEHIYWNNLYQQMIYFWFLYSSTWHISMFHWWFTGIGKGATQSLVDLFFLMTRHLTGLVFNQNVVFKNPAFNQAHINWNIVTLWNKNLYNVQELFIVILWLSNREHLVGDTRPVPTGLTLIQFDAENFEIGVYAAFHWSTCRCHL